MRILASLLLLIVLTMTGCSQEKQEKSIKLAGSVKTMDERVLVYGKTDLPESAVVKGILKDISSNKIYMEQEAKVDKEGAFSISLKRPELEQEYELQVLFLPEMQPENIQKEYGKQGLSIKKDSPGFFTYKVKGETYQGVRQYDRISKIITKGPVKTLGQNSMLMEKLPPSSE